MIETFVFWVLKPLAELAVAVVFALAIAALYGLALLPQTWKRARCRHPRVFENRACDAICSHCGKNLGFIGSWREKNPRKDDQPAA